MSQIFTCVTSFSSEALLQLLRRQQPGPRARHQVVQPAQEEVQRAQGLGGGGGRGAAQEEALLQQISGKAGEGNSLPEIEIGGNFKLQCSLQRKQRRYSSSDIADLRGKRKVGREAIN